MFVSRSMTRKVITITGNEDILEAQALMARYKIRHLPVVDESNRVIGIVTDRDIRRALPSSLLQASETGKEIESLSMFKTRDIMTRDPVTISPAYTIQDALLLIQKKRVGAFPVVDEKGILKGMLSIRDLVDAFINVLGIGEPGTLLCILVEEKIGEMKRIVDAITEENISFGSILVARYWEEDKRAVFPYILTQNVGPVKRKLKRMGFTILDPMEWYIDQLPQSG